MKSPTQIGHPSIDGGRVFYAVSKRHGNSIKRRSLRSGKAGTVLHSHTDELVNPTALGKHLLYVRVSRGPESPQATHPRKLRQRLMLKKIGSNGPGHTVYSHGADRTLWTTALSGKRAYVTALGGGGPKIVSVQR